VPPVPGDFRTPVFSDAERGAELFVFNSGQWAAGSSRAIKKREWVGAATWRSGGHFGVGAETGKTRPPTKTGKFCVTYSCIMGRGPAWTLPRIGPSRCGGRRWVKGIFGSTIEFSRFSERWDKAIRDVRRAGEHGSAALMVGRAGLRPRSGQFSNNHRRPWGVCKPWRMTPRTPCR